MTAIFGLPLALITVLVPATVAPNEGLWKRIDALNAAFTRAHAPSAEPVLGPMLQEAVAILRDFDPEYQRIRADALDTDFTQAEALAKRAAPVLKLGFDGDTDTEFVDFAAFAKQAAPKTPELTFFEVYKATAPTLAGLSRDAECLLPFDLPRLSKKKLKKTEALALWKDLRDRLGADYLREVADRAMACLGDANKRQP